MVQAVEWGLRLGFALSHVAHEPCGRSARSPRGWKAGIYEGRRVLHVADSSEETGHSTASRTLTAAWASSSQVRDDTQDCPTKLPSSGGSLQLL